MHNINITLDNLKTALIFSMKIRETLRLDMVYVRAKLQNFPSLRARSEEPPPPPPSGGSTGGGGV